MFEERKPKVIGKPKSPIFGVGINDADYVTAYKDSNGKQITCPYYSKWYGVLQRCYSNKFLQDNPSYLGCTLVDEWKLFTNFKSWMQSQDWENKHLDKDLINWDNKQYGPNTCVFISPALNNLLCLRNNYRGELPLGVYKHVIKGITYFVASCSFYGKQQRLGYFKTIPEAADTYKKAKLKHIKELSEMETNPRVKEALLNLW